MAAPSGACVCWNAPIDPDADAQGNNSCLHLHLLPRGSYHLILDVQVLPLDGDDAGEGQAPRGWQAGSWHATLHEVVLPLAVLAIGMGVSLLALKPLLWPRT